MTTNTKDQKSNFKQFSPEEKKAWLEKKVLEDESIQEQNLLELRDTFIQGIKNVLDNPSEYAWKKSWINILNPDSSAFPEKFTDTHQYGYNNGLKLLITAQKRGYVDNRWLTLSEARKLGLEFIGDEKLDFVHISRPIIQRGYGKSSVAEEELSKAEQAREAKRLKTLAETTGNKFDPEKVPTTKKVYKSAPVQRFTFFKVYNLSLFKGYEASSFMGFTRNEAVFKSEDAEKMVKHLGARVRFGSNAAYFVSTASKEDVDNFINMPFVSQFNSYEEFISVFSHEAIHYTGAACRLNRKESDFYKSLSQTKAKAFEELVAEIGAALICIKLGISNAPMRENHFTYLAEWISGLDNDLTYITEAMKFANSAIYYIESTVRKNIENNILSDLQDADANMLRSEPFNNDGFPVISETVSLN